MAIDRVPQQCVGFIEQEYMELLQIVGNFDERFMLVKGWSVTFSLATLALALQQRSNALLFVAALSALGFWSLETSMKAHQTSYYPRMRQIEVLCHQDGKAAPGVDWAWQSAAAVLSGDKNAIPSEISEARQPNLFQSHFGLHATVAFYPHVFLPHLVTIFAAVVVFVLSRRRAEGSNETQTSL